MHKIAVCFAGLPRLTDITTSCWKEFIENNNAEVFVHTWSNQLYFDNSIKNIINTFSPKQIKIEKPKSFDTSIYVDRVWPHRSNPNNVLSMWYSIYESINLCYRYSLEKRIKYDIVCRARFDWYFNSIHIEEFNGITVPDDPGLNGHHFEYYEKQYLGHNDQFGYGDMNSMIQYANTFNKIPDLYKSAKVDFCSELFLTANLIEVNIPVNFQKDITYRIIK